MVLQYVEFRYLKNSNFKNSKNKHLEGLKDHLIFTV